ncbi:MAG: hypothetical protein ACOCV3_04775 [Halanaerobiales bacterium]
MYTIMLYIFAPLILLLLGIIYGLVNIKRAVAILSFFLGLAVPTFTGNLLATEFFWVLSAILIQDWEFKEQGQTTPMGM